MVVHVGLAPFYLDVDETGVLLSGRAWLILAWKDHRDTDREREIQFDMVRKRESQRPCGAPYELTRCLSAKYGFPLSRCILLSINLLH